MEGILALCVAMIFSGWVWSLKQDLIRLQKEMHEDAGVPAEDKEPDVILAHATKPRRAAQPVLNTGSGCSRVNGVPTWTIG